MANTKKIIGIILLVIGLCLSVPLGVYTARLFFAGSLGISNYLDFSFYPIIIGAVLSIIGIYFLVLSRAKSSIAP